MKEALFRYFLHKNFPEVTVEHAEAAQINADFNRYLAGKCNAEQLQRIMPLNAIQVIMDSDHPFMIHGFNPALVLHFTEFLKEKIQTSKN